MRRKEFLSALTFLTLLVQVAVASGGDEGGRATSGVGGAVHLGVEADLVTARAGAPEGWLEVTADIAESEALTLGLIPEKSAYCEEPSPLGDRCQVPPDSLFLRFILDNLAEHPTAIDFEIGGQGLAWSEPGSSGVPAADGELPRGERTVYLGHDPTSSASEPLIVSLAPVLPGELVYVNVVITFAAERGPDRLVLNVVAAPEPVLVETEEVLLSLALTANEGQGVAPGASVPGVSVPAFAVAEDGRLELAVVRAPGFIRSLDALAGVDRLAPLYRIRASGVSGGPFELTFPTDVVPQPEADGRLCAASYADGRWTLWEVERSGDGSLSILLGPNAGETYVTLVRKADAFGTSCSDN